MALGLRHQGHTRCAKWRPGVYQGERAQVEAAGPGDEGRDLRQDRGDILGHLALALGNGTVSV